KAMQDQVPGFRLVRHTLLRLPAGPVQFLHWSKAESGSIRAAHFIEVDLYENGRHYRMSFAVSDAAFERRREAIGFILANFATSAVARPCCADPVALP
ncbi:MAG TPA: hypothetical protein VEA41_12000, partial [Salinarimonas sp.]|nr:hypothetical protein [Salinarimonas sp.]